MKINKKEILKNTPDKNTDKNTTSIKFKKDLIDWLGDRFHSKTCFELGTYKGYTTRTLSFFFKHVFTFDNELNYMKEACENNKDRTNIQYVHGDLYKIGSYDAFRDFRENDELKNNIEVILVDANHNYINVIFDVLNCIKINPKKSIYFIFDDYGLIPSVKSAVDDLIKLDVLTFVRHLGCEKGTKVKENNTKGTLKDFESIVCKSRIMK